MTPGAARFPFVDMDPSRPGAVLMPYIPLTLIQHQQTASVLGLLDTGATVSVLPLDLGTKLGFVWAQQTVSVRLTGNLSAVEARGVVVLAQVAQFPPVRLVFAWAQSNSMPVILGQTNFFAEFDAWFSRSQAVFEVKPK